MALLILLFPITPTQVLINLFSLKDFSAPGGIEVNSRGSLDLFGEEYSVYNALPWRNMAVRNSVNAWSTLHCGQFGIASCDPWGETKAQLDTGLYCKNPYSLSVERTTNVMGYNNTVGGYHKVNRNPWYSMSGAACPYGIIQISASAGQWATFPPGAYISIFGGPTCGDRNTRYNLWFHPSAKRRRISRVSSLATTTRKHGLG